MKRICDRRLGRYGRIMVLQDGEDYWRICHFAYDDTDQWLYVDAYHQEDVPDDIPVCNDRYLPTRIFLARDGPVPREPLWSRLRQNPLPVIMEWLL